MKKFALPIAGVCAITAMAIAFSGMTAPTPAQAETTKPVSTKIEAPASDSCCDKPMPVAKSETKDCSDCPDKAKASDCNDCEKDIAAVGSTSL